MSEQKRVNALKREPIVEPHKTVHKAGKHKDRPFVLVSYVQGPGKRIWTFKNRYATAKAREQAKHAFDRSYFKPMRYEEYEE